jgi:16S rRNA (guanine1207-N2)-methyltransferase
MNHGEVFWFAVPADASHLARRLEPEAPALVEGRFRSAPGMFSHRHSDPGSRLLAESIPAGLSGRVADFGAGWGYLSAMLLDRCPHLSGIDLYEADFDALGAARHNVVARPGVELAFLWRDLLQEPAERRYDAVVMNPPFHAGRKANPELGRAMIAAAARALKPGGRLFMVANLGLPYQAALRAGFRHVRELGVGSGFKVIEAIR